MKTKQMKPAANLGIWFILLFPIVTNLFAQQSSWKNLIIPYYSKKFIESDQSYWIANTGGLVEINKHSLKQKFYHPDNSGLIGCDLNDILVIQENDIFIATQAGGIIKFDGVQWMEIPNEDATNKIQSTNYLLQDYNKNIWFVADQYKYTSSGNIFMIKNGTSLRAIGKFSIPGLKCLAKDQHEAVWASDSKYLYKLSEHGITDTVDLSALLGLNSYRLNKFYFDSLNNLFIHTFYVNDLQKRVDNIFKYVNGQFIQYWSSDTLDTDYEFRSLYFNNNTFYILASSINSSYVTILNNGIHTKLPRVQIAIPENQQLLEIIGIDRTNNICFQTFDSNLNRTGVFLDGQNSTESLVKSELPFYRNGADAMAATNDHSMWVAIAGECYQYLDGNWLLRDHHFFNVPPSYSCVEIKTDPLQQQLYFVFKEFPVNKSIIKIFGNSYVESLVFPESVTDLSVGSDDQFLLISNGVLHIYNKDQLIKWNAFNGNVWESISQAFLDPENKIWITSYDIDLSTSNFYLLDKGRLIKKAQPANFDFNQFTFLHADQSGHLIGSSIGRIWKYSMEQNTYQFFEVPSTQYSILQVFEDRSGYYWLSTDNGMYRWDGNKEFINWNFYEYPLLQALVKKIAMDNFNNLWISQSNGLTLFNPTGLSNQYNTTRYKIKGQIYFDIDKNGLRDPVTEPLLPYRTLKLPDSNKEFFTQSGDYHHYLLNLDQKLEIKLKPNEILSSKPESYLVNKSNYDQISFDFGIWSEYPSEKVTVDVYSSRTRCLSDKQFIIQVYNQSPINSVQTLVFKPDADYLIKSCSIPFDRVENQAYIWDRIEIKPFDYYELRVIARAPGQSHQIDVLSSDVYLTDKLNPEIQNVQNISDTLFCSFDPNDKIQDFYGQSRGSQSLKSNLIKYTIRFQNTGNDTAFSVYILDTLDSNLDINSIELINSSHPCTVELLNNTILKFLFPGIHLPFQKQDDLGSQGFASFKIKAKSNIAHQTEIKNQASIYFDLNEAIHTNCTAFTSVDYFPKDPSPKTYSSILIKPNPSSQLLHLEFEEHALFKLYNFSGQFLFETNETNIPIEHLANGIYFIHSVTSDGRRVTAHFVKMD